MGYGPTDLPTDTPSYRDAKAHLTRPSRPMMHPWAMRAKDRDELIFLDELMRWAELLCLPELFPYTKALIS